MPRKSFLDKYSIATRRRLRVWFAFFVIIVIIFGYYLSVAIGNAVASKRMLEDRKIELVQEQQRRSTLHEDLKKLEDPEYIQQYARGTYHYAASGEIIFILPSSDPEDTLNENSASNETKEEANE